MGRRATALNNLGLLAQRAADQGFENYGGGGNYEVAAFENFLIKQGRNPADARNIAASAMQKPELAVQLRKAMNNPVFVPNANGTGGAFGPVMSQTPGNVISAAKLTILVKRGTVTIPAPLPYVLFGPNDSENGYRQIIGALGFDPLVPAATVLTSVRFGENAGFPSSLVFTYTNGANVDTVTVSCPTCPYPILLKMLFTAMMQINQIRLKLSDATQLSQFDQSFVDVSHSGFGPVMTNPITPADFSSPQQFQQGIVDIDLAWSKDNEGSFASNIINVANFQVNHSISINRFYKQIAKGWAEMPVPM